MPTGWFFFVMTEIFVLSFLLIIRSGDGRLFALWTRFLCHVRHG